MKQAFLPGFPHGAERIGSGLSILKEAGTVTYFVGGDNYFSHALEDRSGERFALTSLMANRHVRAAELAIIAEHPASHPDELDGAIPGGRAGIVLCRGGTTEAARDDT